MMHHPRLLIPHPMLWVVIRMIQEMTAEMRMKMTTTLMKEEEVDDNPRYRGAEYHKHSTKEENSVFFFVRYCSTWGTP
jgi:hypothetical protein